MYGSHFRRAARGRHRRRGGGDPYFVLMMLQLVARIQRLRKKPPLTIGLIAFMVFLHFAGGIALQEVCLSASNGDAFRLIASAFFHADDYHLYYNISSLLYKGIRLELAGGSFIFGVMSIILLLLAHGLYICLGGLSFPPAGSTLKRDTSCAVFRRCSSLTRSSSTPTNLPIPWCSASRYRPNLQRGQSWFWPPTFLPMLHSRAILRVFLRATSGYTAWVSGWVISFSRPTLCQTQSGEGHGSAGLMHDLSAMFNDLFFGGGYNDHNHNYNHNHVD